MKKTSKQILFFGNERIATGTSSNAPTLSKLVHAGYRVGAVIASNDRADPSRKQRELEVATVAAAHNIPVLLPKRLRDARDEIESYGAHLGVLVAYGKIIPQSIIDIFPQGIANIHPSLLPLHRGPTPIESAIRNGESKTGVSIMKLAKEMDAGPVYAQKELKLNGHESKQELADRLLDMGGDLLLDNLPGIFSGSLKPVAQIENQATYDNLIHKSDGSIDWSKTANDIEREIRAYAGWPGSRTTFGGKEVIITKARVVQPERELRSGEIHATKRTLLVGCGQGSALSVDLLKPLGKQEMSATAFLAGHRNLLA